MRFYVRLITNTSTAPEYSAKQFRMKTSARLGGGNPENLSNVKQFDIRGGIKTKSA